MIVNRHTNGGPMHVQFTLDGRQEIRGTPAEFVQSGLFDVAPTSTLEGDAAPALVAGQLDIDARTHEPMCTAPVRRRGAWS
jgi:hypothetical protein